MQVKEKQKNLMLTISPEQIVKLDPYSIAYIVLLDGTLLTVEKKIFEKPKTINNSSNSINKNIIFRNEENFYNQNKNINFAQSSIINPVNMKISISDKIKMIQDEILQDKIDINNNNNNNELIQNNDNNNENIIPKSIRTINLSNYSGDTNYVHDVTSSRNKEKNIIFSNKKNQNQNKINININKEKEKEKEIDFNEENDISKKFKKLKQKVNDNKCKFISLKEHENITFFNYPNINNQKNKYNNIKNNSFNNLIINDKEKENCEQNNFNLNGRLNALKKKSLNIQKNERNESSRQTKKGLIFPSNSIYL